MSDPGPSKLAAYLVETRFPCPCCGLPTLAEQAMWNICPVCWWEDDGQGDATADEVWGGPNGVYSLSDARRNFADHGHMYAAGAGIDVVERPTIWRQGLVDYALQVTRGEIPLDIQQLAELMVRDRLGRS